MNNFQTFRTIHKPKIKLKHVFSKNKIKLKHVFLRCFYYKDPIVYNCNFVKSIIALFKNQNICSKQKLTFTFTTNKLLKEKNISFNLVYIKIQSMVIQILIFEF